MKMQAVLGVLFVAFVIFSLSINLPDIIRYLRLRSMAKSE